MRPPSFPGRPAATEWAAGAFLFPLSSEALEPRQQSDRDVHIGQPIEEPVAGTVH